MARLDWISRAAMALALVGGLGVIAAPQQAVAKEKKEKKAEGGAYSDGFRQAAGPIQTAISEAATGLGGNPTPEQLAAAKAKADAGMGGDPAGTFAKAEAVATTPADKLALGMFIRNYGVISQDQQMILKGYKLSIGSGAMTPEELGQANFNAGVTLYQTKDYAGAATYLKAAKDAGYKDPQGQLDAVLADAYKRSGNSAAAMQVANQDIAAARAAGGKPSEASLRAALQAAYDAKNLNNSVDLSTELVRDYPSPDTWNIAIRIVRDLTKLPTQENLDLMRLMSRTNSMTQKIDYVEYIQNADPRRLPGESIKVIDAGVASGKLEKSDSFVSEMRGIASGRLSSDRASLTGLERDARAGSASAATVAGAADAFLSYDQPAKAEELYRSALAKPGVDKDRVLTRLGIAQSDQGKFAEAKTSFGQVTGTRTPIAKLWSTYTEVKIAGTGAPATPPAQ